MILNDTILKKNLRKIVELKKEVEDIIVFGSVVRGKEKPGDIDLIVIFKNKVIKEIEYQIRKEIEKKYEKVSIISKTSATIFDPAFDARESILFEGKSLLKDKNIAEQYGYNSVGMFKYNFHGWSKLQKLKYYYALNGRDTQKGILLEVGGIKLGDGIVLVPLHKVEAFRSFLEFWKVEYQYIPVLIPQRLNQKKILES
ncbi:MAG TPA: nucleotidyltransferase domain-containing protein [Candidatus Nanoarchaeia archaeon]|nr:nucleotidyltransferase domain-containing protein [Candidatus Nanoarchaeia archaeon]